MPWDPMGNVCGCVRAEKEEQYFDPAKTPLSPEKYPPGRKYFRRNKAPVGRSSEREGNKGGGQSAGEQPAVSSRELVPEDPATSATPEGGVQPGKTVAADHSEQKPLPSAVDNCSYRVTVSSAQSSDSEVQVSAPDKTTTEKDSTPYCTERERHLGDVTSKQRTFQRKDDAFLFQKAASLSSILCVTEKSFGNRAFVENLSKSYGSVQEHHRTERIHPHETHHLQFPKRRSNSLHASVSSVSKDTPENDGCEVSEISVTNASPSHTTLEWCSLSV